MLRIEATIILGSLAHGESLSSNSTLPLSSFPPLTFLSPCFRNLSFSADQHTACLLHLLSTPLISNLLLALQQASSSAQTTSSASSLPSSSASPQKELEIILKTLANIVKLIGEFCDLGKWGTGIDGPVGRARESWSSDSEKDAREMVGRKIGELLEVSDVRTTT